MSHYEERLQKDLDALHAQIKDVGAAVVTALQRSTRALLALDRAAAAEVIVDDMPINRTVREIDRQVHLFVSRHLPSAGILRFISSMLRMTVAIERIGDYAASIARQTVQLSEQVPVTVARDAELMSEQSINMLKQALKAFVEGNAELARGTKAMESQIDSSFERVFADLLREGDERSRPIADLFALLVVFNRLERVSDLAKNICEETIFSVTGETKEPKVYRLLFIDGPNSCWSPLAEAIARRAFPNTGAFASAGWSPAEGFEPAFEAFLEQKGLEKPGAQPHPLPTTHDELDDYHVIVNLDRGIRDHLAELPFKTVLLDWDLIPEGGVNEETLVAAYQDLAIRIRDLMERLRGEGAD